MEETHSHTAFTPTPGSRVLTTFFEDGVPVHAVPMAGRDMSELRYAYLLAERSGGSLEVLRTIQYEYNPYGPADFTDAPASKSHPPVHYQPENLPTIADIAGKTPEELEASEFTWHQGSLSVEVATEQLLEAATRLLLRYLRCIRSSDTGVDVVLAFAPTNYCVTHTHISSPEDLQLFVAANFAFGVRGVLDGAVDCGFDTPWGFITPRNLAAYELSSSQTPLTQLKEVLRLMLDYEVAEEEFVAACERASRTESDEEEVDVEDLLDIEVVFANTFGAEEYERRQQLAREEYERAGNRGSSVEELVECLSSTDATVRARALRNPSMPVATLQSYARLGTYTSTRLEVLDELQNRNALQEMQR